VKKKSEEMLQKMDKNDNLLKKFAKILDDKFDKNSLFLEVYMETLNEVIQSVRQQILEERDYYVLAKCLKVSLNPPQTFEKKDFDFNIFYENMENTDIQDLKNELKDFLK